MTNPKETELLDLLESGIVGYTKQFLEKLDLKDFVVTEKIASNLVGKIGTRIAWRDTLGAKRVDEIILKKND